MNNNYDKLKCIWMTSQVIEYKLCDNQFDCENCLFDKVMRNLVTKKETPFNGTTDVVDLVADKLRNIQYDTKLIYLKNNLIAKEICPNTYYLGISPILTCFLDSVSSVKMGEYGKNIFTGQQLVQILGTWGAFSISAPISFVIYDKVCDPTDTPLKSQWFAIIGVLHQELLTGALHPKEWDDMHERAMSIIEEIKSRTPRVGDTMMDGGIQIKFLYQLVGNKKYISILNSI